MRRPLRFLSHKLGLEPEQIATLAEVLADLRTERDARDVEHQRALKLYADAMKAQPFDVDAAKRGKAMVTAAHDAQQTAVIDALGKLHGMLDESQRTRLSAIMRADPFLL